MLIIPRQNFMRAVKKAILQPNYAWRAFYRRNFSYLTYKFFDGYSAYPETISFFLTYRCNLRCKMCGQWGENGVYHDSSFKEELSLEEIITVLNNVRSFKPNITLFGGEPFLYQHWKEIIYYAKKLHLRINVITNGVLLEKYAEAILYSGIDEIIVSLDGPKEIHDSIRNKIGTFDKVKNGVIAINRLKDFKNRKKPIINVTTVVMEDNYKYLEEIVEVAQELRAHSVTFHHLIFINNLIFQRLNQILTKEFSSRQVDWAGFIRSDLPSLDMDKLIDQIHKLTMAQYNIDVSFYPNFTDHEIYEYYRQWIFLPQSYPHRCISPWMVAYIFPDGSVRPFHSVNFVAGNIKEETFKNIWNNDRYRSYRRFIKSHRCLSVCPRCTEFYRY